MGKSQRYQAAVYGQIMPPGSLEIAGISEKTLALRRPEPEYEIHPQTLGDGLQVTILCFRPLLGAFFIARFPRRKGESL